MYRACNKGHVNKVRSEEEWKCKVCGGRLSGSELITALCRQIDELAHKSARSDPAEDKAPIAEPISFEAEKWQKVGRYEWAAVCRWPKGVTPDELNRARKEGGRGITIDGIPVPVTDIDDSQPVYAAPFEESPARGEKVGFIVRALGDCPACNMPVFSTPSGTVCVNGHGGVEPKERS